ncbi:PRLI-interacting factor [Tasmannia lanceolata]|uniref:PRLI-interacting factor n=1 Tax=Tasmannia lanceolata TaxID=3420 RepID=UPI0040642A12
MTNRNYGIWPPISQPEDAIIFQNLPRQVFPGNKPEDSLSFGKNPNPRPVFASSNPNRINWKGKKAADKRRKDKLAVAGGYKPPAGGGPTGYKPPTLNELQYQNRMKARRFYPKKKFNRFAPFAPRNTTSFIIRAKKSGGITDLVSPCPVTPAILPTPNFSPSREVLVDMAKEEWGVDGYGTMKGLIRLRSPGHEVRDEEDEYDGSSDSDVEEHVEVERRLDHDLSRFEMVCPNFSDEHANLLENRVDDQDTHIAQLEEENLTLKERLFLMDREMTDLRRRLQCLETENLVKDENNDEGSENEGVGDVCSEKSVGDCSPSRVD